MLPPLTPAMVESSLPPLTVITQNARGLRSANRLDHFVAGMNKKKADVVLAQEHGLRPEDKSRLMRTARRYGYLAGLRGLPPADEDEGWDIGAHPMGDIWAAPSTSTEVLYRT